MGVLHALPWFQVAACKQPCVEKTDVAQLSVEDCLFERIVGVHKLVHTLNRCQSESHTGKTKTRQVSIRL